MPRRRSTRHYTFQEPQDDTSNSAQLTRTRTATADSTSNRLPSSRPTKRTRTTLEPPSATPTTPIATSSSASRDDSAEPAEPQQPLVSLARLPLDILLRVAELLVPTVSRTKEDGTVSQSNSWTDHGADLVAFTSTCKAAWNAARHLVGRSYGCKVGDATFAPANRMRRRLRALVSDEEFDRHEPDTSAASRSRWLAPVRVELHERVPASRVRHLYLSFSGDSTLFSQVTSRSLGLDSIAEELARKLPLLTHLESLALVWRDERAVVETSPYSVGVVPADVLVALAAHPTLRDLYLCGIKFSHRFADGRTLEPEQSDELHFQQLRALTLNACHDSALEIITMAGAGLREARAWRDFAREPRVDNEYWWDVETWKSVEEVELKGFDGTLGTDMLDHWLSTLRSARSLTPPVFLPLRSLRLSEPHAQHTLRADILPLLADLPHLTTFSFFVWNERSFGPPMLQAVYDALPQLEELGMGLENEGLNWWAGSLTDYAAVLRKFPKLRSFTWNYSPYADLDFPEVCTHVLPALFRSFFHDSFESPTLRSLRWFGEPRHLTRVEVLSLLGPRLDWFWSSDERFQPPKLPWVVEAERKVLRDEQEQWRKFGIELAGSDGGEERDMRAEEAAAEEDSDDERGFSDDAAFWANVPDYGAEDPAARWGMSAKRKGKERAEDPDADSSEDEDDKENASSSRSATASASTSAPRRTARKSLGELLQAAKRESVRSGKGKCKAVEPPPLDDDGEGEAGNDSGFYEWMPAEW
ncbi:hypothetical protein JCM10207_007567 [Rhodosporidiobolus poonsookiae]